MKQFMTIQYWSQRECRIFTFLFIQYDVIIILYGEAQIYFLGSHFYCKDLVQILVLKKNHKIPKE